MPAAIIFALGAMVFWGVGDFLVQKTVKRIGVTGSLFWIMAGGAMVMAPFAFKYVFLINGAQLLLLSVLGLFFFLGSYVHYKALVVGKLSVVEIILSLELLLTILLGVVFFHERLLWWQIGLLAVLFSGIVLISVNFRKKISSRDFLEKGALLAFISAFLLALINFLTALGAKGMDPILTIAFSWLVCGLVCLGSLIRRGDFKIIIKRSLAIKGLVIPMVAANALGWICYALAASRKELYIVAAISENFVVVAFFLGTYFNREKISKRQYVGAFLAVAASLLIGLAL
jgi:drug/metabolite transporter (DMT)-like permease